MPDKPNPHALHRFRNVLMNLSWQLAHARLELSSLSSDQDTPKGVSYELNELALAIDDFRDHPVMRPVRDGIVDLIELAQEQRKWDMHDDWNEEQGSMPNPADHAN